MDTEPIYQGLEPNKTITTFMQIDLQNLFFEARNKGQKIDFEKIWVYFNERETEFMTDAIVYMIRSEDFDGSKFESKLKSIGYNLKIKDSMKTYKNNKPVYRQSNQDVAIAVDCIERINSFDKWIIMSGDGDFVDICKSLKQKGKKIEIWSFKECYNSLLEPYADKLHFIDETFFYKKPKINVFGFHWGHGMEENE